MRKNEQKSDPYIGMVIDDKYKVISKIGSGGMGVVYKGKHILLKRDIAIKFLETKRLIRGSDGLKRFHNEAMASCTVNHTNAIDVFDFDIHDNFAYMVMEYLDGIMLSDILREYPSFSFKRIYSILNDVCGALSKAHSYGVIHRDLKPGNIMVMQTDDGREWAKVLDFGIAKILKDENQDTHLKTSHGKFIGTAAYASPEQAKCIAVDSRTDIYALGIILYQLLTGTIPFNGSDASEILDKQINQIPISMRKLRPSRKIPQAVENVTFKALQKNPDERYDSVLEFINDLKMAIGGYQNKKRSETTTLNRHSEKIYSADELIEVIQNAVDYFKQGKYISSFEILNTVIENHVCEPQMIYLASLSLARCGATVRAIHFFNHHKTHLPKSEDYFTLEARLVKDLYYHSTDTDHKLKFAKISRDLYYAAFRKMNGYFSAINAATLSYLIGDRDLAKKLAHEVIMRCSPIINADYRVNASLAEAYLIIDDYDSLTKFIDKAILYSGSIYSMVSATYRQLSLICEAKEISQDIIKLLQPPKVIYFSSSRQNKVKTELPISDQDVKRLRNKIRETILSEHIGIAFGYIGSVPELIFAEEFISSGKQLILFLPYQQIEFEANCIKKLGGDWPDRFMALLTNESVIIDTLTTHALDDHDMLIKHVCLNALGSAKIKAQILDAQLAHVTLYPQKLEISAKQNKEYVSSSNPVDIKSPFTMKELKAGQENKLGKGQFSERHYHSIIFVKLQNVDSIPEFERSRFMSKWDQDLYGILDALNHEIVDLNVFAEEALIVLNCPLAAYQVGNQIIDLFAGKRVYAPDENDIPKIKLCLHAGPILSITSRFSKNPTYFGDALRRSRFTEPYMLENSVFATGRFMAMLAARSNTKFKFEYTGSYKLTGDHQKIRLYNLSQQDYNCLNITKITSTTVTVCDDFFNASKSPTPSQTTGCNTV